LYSTAQLSVKFEQKGVKKSSKFGYKLVKIKVTVQGVIKKMSYMELDGITMNKQL